MKLLDTHVLIWMLYEPEKLSERAKGAIAMGDNAVSIASLWELSIKISLGKLKLRDSLTRIAGTCKQMGISILNITPEHCQKIQHLGDIHRDPFDRMIVSQAACEGMTVISKDDNIQKYPDVEVIW